MPFWDGDHRRTWCTPSISPNDIGWRRQTITTGPTEYDPLQGGSLQPPIEPSRHSRIRNCTGGLQFPDRAQRSPSNIWLGGAVSIGGLLWICEWPKKRPQLGGEAGAGGNAGTGGGTQHTAYVGPPLENHH